ncbi:MAG: peptidase M16 [Sphingobacteriales bacterium 17-39-43]|uniref:M16 family metallopeptidase n=1 Tax=Daejeonella sp. TaxID=2805397 RepID=UPI000BD9F6B1|nr:insulinase family protein [Daejeonella sp.]OYZ32498.1 MAG: peptidase M16 [Sphingobacteriales bacterium 16-39-50]OZA25861.1 MAG: peptidase M16 [Sphingobacteriales bacterium 17-39-43]HQT21941.1 insulinase family protein [Daejeonella sp.]HQT57248.1 insulinase family protein [Daejeonella sp.]
MKFLNKSVLTLSVAVMFAAAGVSNAQTVVKSKPAVNKQVPSGTIPLDPAIRTGKLPNGFTYYIRKNIEPKNRVQLYLANKIGSIMENDDQRGLAHFMEHMGFNGTKNFPKNDLVNYLQKAGVRFGADLNAYTSFDETVYQLPIPSDDPEVLKNGIQIMRDWAQDATLDPAEIDKERGVVLEEKRLGKGAQQRMQDKYLPMLFNNSRYSDRLPIGTEEVLKNFSTETIKQFYKDWYRPDLQALIVVGDIDVDAMEQTIKAKFSDLKNPAKPRQRTKYSISLLNKNQFIAVTDKEFPVSVAQIMIKHPESKLITTTDYRNSILRSLFNSMIGTRFADMSKQADPPFLQAGANISGFLAGLDMYNVFVVAKPGEMERGFKAILTETERVQRFGFTQTELDRAKQSYLTNMESAFKEKDKTPSESLVNEYLRHFLEQEASPGIEYEYKMANSMTGGISLSDVNNLAKKYITDVNRDVIIMGPEKDKDNLPDEAKVESWISGTKQSNISPYVDQVSDKPLLSDKLSGGKVISESKIPEIGLTEFKLSNGVKVVLKPTDFKNDEISFSAFSAGGSSLYSDADFQSALYATAIIRNGGLGEFNSVQLPKLLSGKKVSVSPYITERFEGISGSTSPKDIETALQLTYLYFTQPRKDAETFKGLIAQQKGGLANRGNDPNSVFADSVAAILGNYNVRRTGPSVEKINQVSLDRAFEIYKDRFADASDFTFVFVGSFNPAELRPLLEQYLGSLPSGNRKETAKDLGIQIPAGKIDKKIYKGQEPKASVRLVFSGDYTWSEKHNNQLNALAEVLTIKLIERLREDEGGVYGVGARASYTKFPKGRYSFSISFGCAPENVEKLISSTLDEINKIRVNGALAGDIEKFIAEETRTTETQLKDNGFWLGYLTSQLQNEEEPKEVLSYLESLKELSPEALKATVQYRLNPDNFIRMVLLPEK